MTTNRDEPADVDEMLRVIDARIRTRETAHQRSLALIGHARERVVQFRREPIGGRLLRLKRIVFWFTASAFDRQAKAQEAIVDALEEIGRELVDLRNRVAVLGNESKSTTERPRAADPGKPPSIGWRSPAG